MNILQQFINRQTRFQYPTIEMIMTVMVFEMTSLKNNDALQGKQYIENEILNLNCSICQLVPPKTYDIAQKLHIHRT